MTNVGQRIKELSYQKGLKQIDLAKLKGVSKQTISHDFKQERLSVESVKWYARTLGVSIEDITKSNVSQSALVSSNEDSSNWKEKYFDLLEESRKMWQVIAQHGLQVDLGKLIVSTFSVC